MFDLAAMYIFLHNEIKYSKENLYTVARNMCMIADAGYTFSEIRTLIFKAWQTGQKLSPKVYGSKKENLIKQKVYLHRRLRKQPPAHITKFDEQTGEYVGLNDEEYEYYFVETVASFTLKDLKEYLLKTKMVDTEQFTEARINGLLKYYIKRFGIEKTLFLIDAASDSRRDYTKTIPLDKLDNYVQDAREMEQRVYNNIKSVEGDKIWAKPRFKKLQKSAVR